MDAELGKRIRVFALDNARKYNGVPNMGSVVGKILSEHPDLKRELKNITPEIKKICDEVRLMSVDKQITELQKTCS